MKTPPASINELINSLFINELINSLFQQVHIGASTILYLSMAFLRKLDYRNKYENLLKD